MKKLGKISLVVGIFVMMLVFAGATLAFTSAPEGSVPVAVEGVVNQVASLANGDGEGRRGGPQGRNGGFVDREAVQEVIAGALGLSVEELQTALESGTHVRDLAEELGVDIAVVESAIESAKVDAINAAVEAGELTQEEADEIFAHMALRQLSHDIFSREDAAAVVAETLGLSVEELEAAKEEGTLEDLISEDDHEAIRTAVQAAREEAVNQAVEDGTITQEQADELLEDGFGKCGGRGGPGRRGGPRGNGNGDGPAVAPQGDNA